MSRPATSFEVMWGKTPKPEDGCWVGPFALNGAGRATFQGRSAPREAYRKYVADPGALHVLHRCDNPACVRLDHLFLGTQRDNMQDCAAKGRLSPNSRAKPGAAHHAAKLAHEQVEEIKRRRSEGEELKAIAKDFPVGVSQVSRIVNGKRWAA